MISDVFCRIIKDPSGNKIVSEGADWLAIEDIHPVAPVHILIIPKKHFESLMEAGKEERVLLGQLLLAAKAIAKLKGLDKKGFRLVINSGVDGGQLVPHFHLHLIGGRPLGPKIIQDADRNH